MDHHESIPLNGENFIQRTFETIALCQTETITAEMAIGVYRLGFTFARDIAQLDQVQAILFAMEYGNFILNFLQRKTTFTRYLIKQFNTGSFSRKETLAKILRDRYVSIGIDPNPVDACGAMHTLLCTAFIFDGGFSSGQFIQQLKAANPVPNIIVDANNYPAVHNDAINYSLAEFQRILDDVQTGRYLLLQENSIDI